MEVDPPSSSSGNQPVSSSNLKRSNSAPMINLLVTTQCETSSALEIRPSTSTSVRRLSSSNLSLQNAPLSASPPIRGTNRVAKLKQEESHIVDRENSMKKKYSPLCGLVVTGEG